MIDQPVDAHQRKVDADQGKKGGDPKSNVKCCYVTLEVTNESAGYDEGATVRRSSSDSPCNA